MKRRRSTRSRSYATWVLVILLVAAFGALLWMVAH